MSSQDHLEPPLASLSLTHVYYNPHDPVSLVSAWLALVPQALVISYTALIWGQREVELILMFAGQLGCEAVNWVLKRLLKEARPTQMHGKGYGMPSSHAQFVAFFSVYITLWVLLRCGHLSSFKRAIVPLLSFSGAAAISLSRIYLSYHTPKQVLAGSLAGTILAIFWFSATSFLRHSDIRIAEKTPWQWILWVGSLIYVKDMCLDVDIVEQDYNLWKAQAEAHKDGKNKVN